MSLIDSGARGIELRREMAYRYVGSFRCSGAGARHARALIIEFARAGLSRQELQDFETAIGEALANAVEHSKGSNLTVECRREHGAIIAEIENDGNGFLPPPGVTRPPKGALRGYGLYIMHRLLDEVEFLDDGKRLRLVKRVL
jgi:anti-sigma regulatory factor (Ser/Thr protein kinase)